jgi:hypothetical protein
MDDLEIAFEDDYAGLDNIYIPAIEEVHPYQNIEPDTISDFDISLTGLPMIEWEDSFYGSCWITYNSQEEYQAAIDNNKSAWDAFNAANGAPFSWLNKYFG